MADTLTLPRALAQADKRWGHARSCKKVLADCATCQDTIRWFADLPLPALARVLEETPITHTHE